MQKKAIMVVVLATVLTVFAFSAAIVTAEHEGDFSGEIVLAVNVLGDGEPVEEFQSLSGIHSNFDSETITVGESLEDRFQSLSGIHSNFDSLLYRGVYIISKLLG